MRLTVEQINELLDGLAKLRQEIDRLKQERDTARSIAAILVRAYDTDNKPLSRAAAEACTWLYNKRGSRDV